MTIAAKPDAETDAAGIDAALARARGLMAAGDDTAARRAYVEILRHHPTHFAALNELAALAHAGGYRSAARRAYAQAVEHHPDNPIGRINLANLLLEIGEAESARRQLQAVLEINPDLAEAHQGLARALAELGDDAAEQHWRKGFAGHAILIKPYRGTGKPVRLLLLVAARGGNIPTQQWIDDRSFAITAVYCDFHDTDQPLPPELRAPFDAILNAIGDADICGDALAGAERLLAQISANPANPTAVNCPAKVRETGRAAIARRLAGLPGVVAPEIKATTGALLQAAVDLSFPLLLRKPGFHTGRHFHYVEDRDGLAAAIAELPPGELLAIQYLDARGSDGMARKYRVMFIDGIAYPLHLAVSADWKVHYFTADMATNQDYRAEEQRFLADMQAALGPRAMRALAAIRSTLDLDYAGIDFALSADGSLLLFEANATMVINPPESGPIWDYRRPAIDRALAAAKGMLLRQQSKAADEEDSPSAAR